jgi:hypothetical protein
LQVVPLEAAGMDSVDIAVRWEPVDTHFVDIAAQLEAADRGSVDRPDMMTVVALRAVDMVVDTVVTSTSSPYKIKYI